MCSGTIYDKCTGVALRAKGVVGLSIPFAVHRPTVPKTIFGRKQPEAVVQFPSNLSKFYFLSPLRCGRIMDGPNKRLCHTAASPSTEVSNNGSPEHSHPGPTAACVNDLARPPRGGGVLRRRRRGVRRHHGVHGRGARHPAGPAPQTVPRARAGSRRRRAAHSQAKPGTSTKCLYEPNRYASHEVLRPPRVAMFWCAWSVYEVPHTTQRSPLRCQSDAMGGLCCPGGGAPGRRHNTSTRCCCPWWTSSWPTPTTTSRRRGSPPVPRVARVPHPHPPSLPRAGQPCGGVRVDPRQVVPDAVLAGGPPHAP